MTLISRIKEHLPDKRKQSGGGYNGKDGSSNPKQHPVPTQPTASGTVAVLSTQVTDPWVRAYEIFQDLQPELAADYKKHLASLKGSNTASADLSTRRSVEAIMNRLLKDREDKQWHISLLGKHVRVREQTEKLVKFLLWTDPIVKNAISAQPYAALAWSGVSLLLPLVTNGTTQNEAMLNGFISIGHVQLYWEIYEKKYPRSEHQEDYQSLIEPLAKLYSQVISYQASAICHLSRAQLSRAWENVAGSNDWDGMTKKIEKFSEECSKIIHLFNEGEIREQWKSQLQKMQESQDSLDEIRRILEASEMQKLKIYINEQETKLLQDLGSDYAGGKDFNPPRVKGTCNWFFTDDQFHKWRDSRTSGLLWVTAGPGCGKSVLSRALIDEGRLSASVTTSTICYFFFKDGEKGRMHGTDALSAVLHQLFSHDHTGKLIGKALPSHKEYGKNLAQTFSELWKILIHCARSSDAGEIVCVLDALDECNEESRQTLIDKLKEFYSKLELSKYPSRLKFLITSRSYPNLEKSFRELSSTTSYWHLDGDSDAKSETIGSEIHCVIDARLKDITLGFKDEDRCKISQRLKDMENRTYLWLYLTFDDIKRAGCESRPDVEQVLSTLSDEVSDKYEKMLGRSTNHTETRILLQIVLAAVRPLTMDEANVALKLASHTEPFASHMALESDLWPRENFPRKVRSLCGLFISIHDKKLSFIHQTAREFLIHSGYQAKWKGCLKMPTSHSTILRSCLHYLALPEIEPPVQDDATRDLRNSFLLYTATQWPVHYKSRQFDVADVESEKEISASVLGLCDPESKQYQAWSSIYKYNQDHEFPYIYKYNQDHEFPRSANSLIVASYFGLEAIVKQLLNTGKADVNSRDAKGRTPLWWAARNGHEDIVKQLIDTGKMDFEMMDYKEHKTPLLAAVANGHEAIVKRLLDTGKVDVNARTSSRMTPLLLAVQSGHEAIVNRLIDTGKVDVNVSDLAYNTPLSKALLNRHEAIVKQLLGTNKVDFSAKDGANEELLFAAAARGHEGIVKQILDANKVDVNSHHAFRDTPLLIAIYKGHEAIVKQLLDTNKVDINLISLITLQTPLLRAAMHGHTAIVRQLLNTGKVDVNSKSGDNEETPLWRAAANGHEAIVELLLNTGKVDVNSTSLPYDKRPLWIAAKNGHEAIVELLLSTGKVDVDSTSITKQTPMSIAAKKGHTAIVKRLQSYKASQLSPE